MNKSNFQDKEYMKMIAFSNGLIDTSKDERRMFILKTIATVVLLIELTCIMYYMVNGI